MWRKRESDLDAGAGSDRAIEVKEDAARADVLGFGEEFVRAIAVETNGGGQSHIETSHRATVWGCWQHWSAFSVAIVCRKHSLIPRGARANMTDGQASIKNSPKICNR